MKVLDRLPPSHFSCDLPGTPALSVLGLDDSDVFGSPSLIIYIADPKQALRNAILMMQGKRHPETIDILVSDTTRGYSYQRAGLLLIELDAADTLTILVTASSDDVQRLPVEAAH